MKCHQPYIFLPGIILYLTLLGFANPAAARYGGIRTLLNDSIPTFNVSAKDHLGVYKISSDSRLTLTSGLYNDFYTSDSLSRTGYIYIAIKAADNKTSDAKRTPLNISVVLDRSGSMAGDKIDAAKKAAKSIVDKLDSTDYISVIIYDNFINIVQASTPDTNKKTIKAKIDRIMPRGSTNLWGGTEKGYNEVLEHYDPEYINRVLLLSDGMANVGIIDAKTIKTKVQQYRDSGISLSTFGVGLDYNEFLMTQMAETGLGNYYFIDSASKLAPLFDKELNSLMHLAAKDVTLTIQLPQGINVEPVYPAKFILKGNELSFSFHDLFCSEQKGVLLKFRIPTKMKTPLKITSSVSYKDPEKLISQLLFNDNTLQASKDLNAYASHYNKGVIQQLLLFYANENVDNALLKADEGDYAVAKKYLDDNALLLKKNQFYVNGCPELEKVRLANTNYIASLLKIKSMNKDAIRMMQKTNADEFYRIRNGKE